MLFDNHISSNARVPVDVFLNIKASVGVYQSEISVARHPAILQRSSLHGSSKIRATIRLGNMAILDSKKTINVCRVVRTRWEARRRALGEGAQSA